MDLGDYKTALEKFNLEYVVSALKATEGNINQAAKRFGIDRTRIYRTLGKYKISPNKFRP